VPYDIVPRRAGDPVASFADPTHANELLGWRARYGLDEILDSAYRWHRAQLDRAAG
jgi:UDP-glucose 4-epimerase